MALLTAGNIHQLRGMIDTALPDSADVTRVTRTPDDAGGQSDNWAVVATVACRVSTLNRLPKEMLLAERITNADLWTITLPADTDVQNDDRIVVTPADGGAARTYEVKGRATEGSWQIETRLVVVELT